MNPRLANDERGLTWTIKNDKITSFIPFKAANEQTTSKYDQDADGGMFIIYISAEAIQANFSQ